MTRDELRTQQQAARDQAGRALVPYEFQGAFRTSDKEQYRRVKTGAIVRATPKVRGKAARKAEKAARAATRA
jgi:hypothetical protein